MRDTNRDQEETDIWREHGASKPLKEYNVLGNCKYRMLSEHGSGI